MISVVPISAAKVLHLFGLAKGVTLPEGSAFAGVNWNE